MFDNESRFNRQNKNTKVSERMSASMIKAKEKFNNKLAREVERVSMRGSVQMGSIALSRVNQSTNPKSGNAWKGSDTITQVLDTGMLDEDNMNTTIMSITNESN
jgi:hypothetical protein